MNLCPCGYLGDPLHQCRCHPVQIQRYESRLSGPLLDRIDLHVEVPAVPYKEITDDRRGEPSAVIRARVNAARLLQKERFQGRPGFYCNSQMGPRDLKAHCQLDSNGQELLEAAVERMGLSARAVHRILKLARTIADLAGEPRLTATHVAEAVQYRHHERRKEVVF